MVLVLLLVLVLVFARAQSLPIFNRCISRLPPARASSCTAAPTAGHSWLPRHYGVVICVAGGARVSSRGSDFRVCRKYLWGVERGRRPRGELVISYLRERGEGGRGERAFYRLLGPLLYAGGEPSWAYLFWHPIVRECSGVLSPFRALRRHHCGPVGIYLGGGLPGPQAVVILVIVS